MICEATAVTALVLGLARFRIKVTQKSEARKNILDLWLDNSIQGN